MTFDEIFKQVIETYNGPDIAGITDVIDKIKQVADTQEATVPKTDFDELQGRYDALDARYRERYMEENFGPQPGKDTPIVGDSLNDNKDFNASAMAEDDSASDSDEEEEEDLVFGDL